MELEIQEFLETLSGASQRTGNTRAAYEIDLRRLMVYLERNSIDRWEVARPEHLQNFLIEEHALGRSHSTLSRRRVVVRRFARFLIARGRLPADFNMMLVLPDAASGGYEIAAPLTVQEQAQLRVYGSGQSSARGLRDWAMYLVLLETSLPIGRLLVLNLSDLEPGRGPLAGIRESKPAMEAYLQGGRPNLVGQPAEQALFVSQMGGRMTRQAAWVMLRHLGEAAGLQRVLTPRCIRHTAAQRMLQSGMQLPDVQRLLGHRVLLSTKILAARLETSALPGKGAGR